MTNETKWKPVLTDGEPGMVARYVVDGLEACRGTLCGITGSHGHKWAVIACDLGGQDEYPLHLVEVAT